jgi:hypothetical protein
MIFLTGSFGSECQERKEERTGAEDRSTAALKVCPQMMGIIHNCNTRIELGEQKDVKHTQFRKKKMWILSWFVHLTVLNSTP